MGLLSYLRSMIGYDQTDSRLALLEQLIKRMDEMNLRLAQLENLAHGGKGVNVGNNRILTRIAIGGTNLAFLIEADDRLIVPRLFVDGRYEVELTNFFSKNIKANDHCLDVGANFGYYTCLMARWALGGKTIGLEPDQKIFELLRDNIYINGLESVASAMHAAAGREEGMLTLHRRLTRSGNTSLIKEPDEKITRLGEAASQAFEIRCVPIDALLPEFDGRIDHLKIDVEGAEPLVLPGARQTIANNPYIKIVMEWAPNQIRAAGFDVPQFTRDLAGMGLHSAILGLEGPAPVSWESLLESSYHSGVLLTASS